MALNTVSSDRLSTNVKNTNFTAAEKQDLTDDIKPLLGSSGGGNKNLIINGAQLIAQRGTSSTSTGYQTVDRITLLTNGVDEAPTQAQVDVASGTTPYTNGFRKALKITNGNQTSGAGSADYIIVRHKIEAQNLANSGWNYTSTSSNVTLSFWVKASVAQNYYFSVLSSDGTLQNFPMETGSLTADTWTKITKTIPGAANVQFNNDNGIGIELDWWPFAGTDYTASGVALNTWAAFASGTRFPDHTSTWYTTNDATLEITGVQLEVGSVATDFEHRSFAQELELCKRYCQVLSAGGDYTRFSMGYASSSSSVRWFNYLRPEMRSTPSFAHSGSFNCQPGSSFDISDVSLETASSSPQQALLITSGNSGMSAGQAISLHANGDANAKLTFSAEL